MYIFFYKNFIKLNITIFVLTLNVKIKKVSLIYEGMSIIQCKESHTEETKQRINVSETITLLSLI